MANPTKTNLKNATCSPGDGVHVNKTKILRGQPTPSTAAWSDSNVTKQHVANDSHNGGPGGAENSHSG